MSSAWVIAPFAAYFALLIGIAIVRARKMRDMSDYVLGARQLGSVTTALSSGSSTTSAWTMLALPALAYAGGVVAWWIPASAVVGIALSWTLLAGRLRRYTIAANDSLTIPEFFEVRFGDRTGGLRTLASCVTILFVVFYISSGLVGGSKLLETIFGVEAVVGIFITLLAVASYTLVGGFLAVSRTDVFQAALMLLSLLLISVTLASNVSGMTDAPELPTGFRNPLSDADDNLLTPLFFISVAGWAFGAFGAQRILQRYMALEGRATVEGSRNLSLLWLILVYALALAVGLLAHAVLPEARLLASGDSERIYLEIAEFFFHPAVTGFLLTAVIAAVMSTADSQLLLASAVAAGDLPGIRDFAARIADRPRVWLGRALLVLIGLIGAVVPILYPESIFDLVSYAWGGMGAAFGPVTILALYWRRFNAAGAGASIATGTLVASTWALLGGGPAGIWDIQPATPGFMAALVIAVLVTLATPAPRAAVLELFDRAMAPGSIGSGTVDALGTTG